MEREKNGKKTYLEWKPEKKIILLLAYTTTIFRNSIFKVFMNTLKIYENNIIIYMNTLHI